MSHLRRITLLLALGALSCSDKGDESAADSTPAPETGSEDSAQVESGPTHVFLITIDTVSRDFLGPFNGEGVSPNMEGFFADAVLFEDVIVPRGLTAVSMATFLSGTYPMRHKIRTGAMIEGDWSEEVPLLAERMEDAGYATWGYLSNYSQYGAYGFNRVFTGAIDQSISAEERDVLLREELISDLEMYDLDDPLFVWIHFLQPHDPYKAAEPWFSELADASYDGVLKGSGEEAIDKEGLLNVALGETPYTDADRDFLHAVYDSELRAFDEGIAELFQALKDLGYYDNSIIVLGSDHGEDLMENSGYPYHGCSVEQEVLQTAWAIRTPGGLEGARITGRISSADIPPTILDLLDIEWTGDLHGVSLEETLLQGTEPSHDVFFEREDTTAGVYRGQYKYFLAPEGTYRNCAPYEQNLEYSYDFPTEALFDLSADPQEDYNLVGTETKIRDELRAAVCEWTSDEHWVAREGDTMNAVRIACE